MQAKGAIPIKIMIMHTLNNDNNYNDNSSTNNDNNSSNNDDTTCHNIVPYTYYSIVCYNMLYGKYYPVGVQQ